MARDHETTNDTGSGRTSDTPEDRTYRTDTTGSTRMDGDRDGVMDERGTTRTDLNRDGVPDGAARTDRNRDGVTDRTPRDEVDLRSRERHTAIARDHVDRQHEFYGGFKWGAAFFGWLSANGLTVLLVAIAAAAGVALGLTEGVDSTQEAADSAADTLGLGGAIALLVILGIGYFAGGYVAGRMARFDGARQGVGVWIIGLLVTIALAVAGVVFGSEYNVLSDLNLPRIPVDEGDATTAGIIALVAVLLVTLFAAILGGKAGERYHRKVDRAGIDA
jgi:hypothetical protein